MAVITKTINGSFDSSVATQQASTSRTYAVDTDGSGKYWSPTSSTSLVKEYTYPINFGFSYTTLSSVTFGLTILVDSSYCSSSKNLNISIKSSNGTELYVNSTQSVSDSTYNYTFTLDSSDLATLVAEKATGLQLYVRVSATASRSTSSLGSAASYSTGYAIKRTHKVWFTVNPTDIAAVVVYDDGKTNATINYYTGSAWKACVPYYHDGSKWVECEAKYYDGSSWKTLTGK